MSSPIRPPLKIETVDGATEGRPINTIKVSNGDLTVSGTTATIDTTGSGGVPGGSTTEIQYNNAGAFAGDAGFYISTVGGGGSTKIQVGNMSFGANIGVQNLTLDGSVSVIHDGTGQIFLQGDTGGGGVWTDTITNVMCSAYADDATLRLRNSSGVAKEANITLDATANLIIDNSYNTDKYIDLKVSGTGEVDLTNTTAGENMRLKLVSDGTSAKSIIQLTNGTETVTMFQDTTLQNTLTIEGYSTFKFNTASGGGYIQFPDGTTQSTAAAGGISGTIADDQIAVGSAADTIEGTSALSFTTSVLTVENQIDLGATGAAGILKNTQNNQDLKLQYTGATGALRIENTTADTDTQLVIDAPGTGIPTFILTNNTKAVTIQCDENQKLKVKGGTEDFIFDVSSATGGITFPDGTTQITAASGGGAAFPAINVGSMTSYEDYRISNATPYGSNDQTITVYALNTRPTAWPFIAPFSGDIGEFAIKVITSSASSSVVIGFYDSDANNLPDNLVQVGTTATDTTGTKTVTVITSTSTLVFGELYWYSVWTHSGGLPTLAAIQWESLPGLGLGGYGYSTTDSVAIRGLNLTTGTTLPATFALDNPQGQVDRPYIYIQPA